jgi:hypothetical protein
MLIIGLGGAQTLEATASSVSEIDVIELEREVVVANRLIPRPNSPLDDPRVTLQLGDARGAMNLSNKLYDAIVSQPSHPWTSGASHLYTHEFFQLVHSKLEPGGIFIQWIGGAFVDVDLFGSLMASMTDVFRYVQVYRPVPAALVFMASDEPIDLLESAPRALAKVPASFGRYGIHRVEDFFASWALDTDGVRSLAKGRPLNTDDHNLLATTRLPPSSAGLNRNRFNQSFRSVEVLDSDRFETVDAVAVIRRMNWNGEGRRARRLATTLPESQTASAEGWLAYDSGRIKRARMRFETALELNPDESSARAGMITIFAGEMLDPSSLSKAEDVVLRANLLLKTNDWSGVRELDAALAEIPPGSFLFESASRARVQWRISLENSADGLQAIAIIDELLSRQRTPTHFLLRAAAGALAGNEPLAWAALEEVASRKRLPGRLRSQALTVARQLDHPPEGSTVIRRLSRAGRPGR